MVLWMRRASAGLSGELRAGMSQALETGAPAVVLLSFLAVGREGFETALFMVGYAEAETAWPLIGLVIGVIAAAGIAWAMYAGAVRVNLAKFFTYTGLFLIIVAAGILSYGIGALQTVGWLPGHHHRAFDISASLDWSAWYGQILQGVFNVTPTPTVLQLLAWLTYLVVVVALFLRNRGGGARKPASASAPTGVSATRAA
jgi:high-affinity iron transporter